MEREWWRRPSVTPFRWLPFSPGEVSSNHSWDQQAYGEARTTFTLG